MAYDTRELLVKINADTADLDKALGKTTNGFKAAGDKIGEFAKVASVALLAVGTAAVGFGIAAVKAFDDGQAVIAQTNAVLQSTGGIAGVTAQQVDDLANKFKGLTKYDDDTVRSAENMLLTFTNIHENVFPATTQAVLDMSTAMGQDLQSTAIQVGKALQDPVLGATALQRVGVRLTQTQKDLIKTMVDAGNTAGAQKIILKELQTEFGGSAEAAGKTFGGQLIITKNLLGDLQKAIGGVIEKAIYPLLTAFNSWFDSIGGVDGAMKILSDTYATVSKAVVEFAKQVWSVAKQVGDYLIPKLSDLWKNIEEHLVPALRRLWKEVIEPLIPVVGTVLVVAIGLAIDALSWLTSIVSGVIDVFSSVWQMMLAGNPFIIGLVAVLGTLATALALSAAFSAFQTGMDTIKNVTIPAVQGSFDSLATKISTPMVMPAVVVAAALIAIDLVYNKAVETMKVVNQTSDIIDAASKDNAATSVSAMKTLKQQHDAGIITDSQFKQKMAIMSRASGGPVSAGQPYLVGDNPDGSINRTTELFVPSTPGNIVKSGDLQSAMGGGSNVTLNVNIGMYAGMPVEKRQIALEMYKELVRAARSQGVNMPMIGAVGVQ